MSWRRVSAGRRWGRVAVAVGAVAASAVTGVAVGAHPAAAHAFLVGSRPAQGERLTRPPATVDLEFSEATGDATVEVKVLGPDVSRVTVNLGRSADGRVERAELGPDSPPTGVYQVTWSTTAVDGHTASGEFAFGVGAVGTIPVAAATAGGGGRWASVARWLFLVGLALAAGGVTLTAAAGRTARAPALAGAAGAVLACAALLPQAIRAGGGRPAVGLVVAGAGVAVAVAAAAGRRRGRWPVAAAGLVVAAGGWAVRSHPATTGGALGWAIDTVHLAAGSAWVGSLVLVTLVLWRGRAEPGAGIGLVRSYARVAAVLVAVLAVAGAVSAFRLLPRMSALWTTGYGRLLLVKTGLFAVALLAAFAGRVGGFAPGRHRPLRRLTSVEVVVVAAVLVVSSVLGGTAPPAKAAGSAGLGPPPFTGTAVRDAGLVGVLTVQTTAGDGRVQVDALVPDGRTNASVKARLRLPDGRQIAVRGRCGPGCVSRRLALPDGDTEVTVVASAGRLPGGTFHGHLQWPPPPPAPGTLDAVVAAMRGAPALHITERAVTVGTSAPTDADLSGVEFLDQEPYAGGLGADQVQRPGPERLTLWVAGENILITLRLDSTDRILTEHLVSPGSQLDRVFTYPP